MRFSRLLIVDNSLKDTAGHHYEYARAVAEEARNRGLAVDIAAHRKADAFVRDTLDVLPVFRWGVYDPMPVDQNRFPLIGKPVNALLFNYCFLRDWRKGKLSRAVDSRTLVFIPNCTEMMALGVALLMWAFSGAHSPKMICLFRPDPRVLMPFVGRLMKSFVRQGSLMLAADSDISALSYEQVTGLRFTVLPIPHPPVVRSRNRRQRSMQSPLRVTYLGDARMEKGIDILAKAIPLLDRPLREKKIEFVLQAHPFRAEPEIAPVMKSLEEACATYDGSVQLVQGSLSTEEYYGLIDDADVIILPYRESSYRARTSGILAEAFTAGKPAIVTRGTWLSQQVDIHGSGVSFNDGDPGDLARAILELQQDSARFAERAGSKAAEWQELHSAKKLVEMILSHWDR